MSEVPGIQLGIRAAGLVPHGHDVAITVNGMDITGSIQRVELRMEIEELNTAILTVLVKEVSVDAAARLLLQARLNANLPIVVEEGDRT